MPQTGAVYEYPTRAAMAGSSNASVAQRLAQCDEVEGLYEFLPNDGSTPDGWLVVASTGTQAGNWKFLGSEMALPILGGGSDDWANYASLSAALSGKGVLLKFKPGTYQCKTTQSTPSNSRIRGTNATIIQMTLPQAGNPLDAAFSARNVVGASTTLDSPAATTTTGANYTQPAVNATVNVQVVNSGAFARGQYVYIAGGGLYVVDVVPDGAHVTVQNLGRLGNAAPAAVIGLGAVVSRAAGIPGSLTMSFAADVANVGDYVITAPTHLGGNAGLRSRTHKVAQKSGLGPFVYTFDTALSEDEYYVLGDHASQCTPPENIDIDGQGMTLQGTATRSIEIEAGQKCSVKNLVLAPIGAGDILASYDIGNADCIFENLNCDGGGTVISDIISIESGVRAILRRIKVRNGNTGNGIECFDCCNLLIEDCDVAACNYGCYLTSDGNAGLGTACTATEIRGGTFQGCTTAGIATSSGCVTTKLVGCASSGNGIYGVLAGDGTYVDVNTKIVSCDLSNNDQYGVFVAAKQPGDLVVSATSFEGCRFGVAAFQAASGGATFVGCTGALPPGGQGLIVADPNPGIIVNFVGCNFTCYTTDANGINVLNTMILNVDDCVLTFATSGIEPFAGGVLNICRTKIFQTPGTAIYGIVNNGGTVRFGDGVDLTGTTNGYLPFAGYDNKFMTVQVNGVANVDVAWPDLKATDDILFTALNTLAGVASSPTPILVSKTPGTGFRCKAQVANDTSTWNFKVA